jgi:hypothetical protein
MGTVLIIILVVLLLTGVPQLTHHSYGYTPVSIITVLLVIVVILMLTGRL